MLLCVCIYYIKLLKRQKYASVFESFFYLLLSIVGGEWSGCTEKKGNTVVVLQFNISSSFHKPLLRKIPSFSSMEKLKTYRFVIICHIYFIYIYIKWLRYIFVGHARYTRLILRFRLPVEGLVNQQRGIYSFARIIIT